MNILPLICVAFLPFTLGDVKCYQSVESRTFNMSMTTRICPCQCAKANALTHTGMSVIIRECVETLKGLSEEAKASRPAKPQASPDSTPTGSKLSVGRIWVCTTDYCNGLSSTDPIPLLVLAMAALVAVIW